MGRCIVVTGCSSGFGRQVSERLARSGDRVYASMRATQENNATAAGGGRARISTILGAVMATSNAVARWPEEAAAGQAEESSAATPSR